MAGIYRDRGERNSMKNAIITGILIKLHTEKRIEKATQENNCGGWKLIESEYKKLNY